jgi:isopentenyldiphosphate isomerase
MVTRKRSRSEAVATTEKQPAEELGLLQRIRNSWEFASLMQYIAIFGGIMKIDNEFEIEVCPIAILRRPGDVAHYVALMGKMGLSHKNPCAK